MKSIAGPHDHAVIRRFSVIAGLGLLLFAGAGLALTIGPYPVPVTQVVTELLMPSGGMGEIVIWNIRAAARARGDAGRSGARLRGGPRIRSCFAIRWFRRIFWACRPGAALGAVIGIFLSLPMIAIQGFAFLGGLGAVALVIFISRAVRGVDQTLVLVLTGVVIGALAGAATSLLKVMADPYDQLPAITFWLLGSLASTTQADLTPVLPAVLIGLVPLILLRWRINLLSLGDDEARALGVDAPAAAHAGHCGGDLDYGLGRRDRRAWSAGLDSSFRISPE